MAYGDTEDAPLVPGTVPQPDVQGAAQTGGLADNWRSWMSDPHNRAAMIQFGLALSQPVSAGQNVLGHIGSAAGQAGEASDRITAEQEREKELESKQELRSAQGDLATERGRASGESATLKQQALDQRRSIYELQDQGRIQAAYNAHLRQIAAENKDITAANLIAPKGQQRPLKEPLSPEDFAGRYRGMGVTGNVAPIAADTSPEGLKQQARDAISKGADRNAVIQRLQQRGIDASDL